MVSVSGKIGKARGGGRRRGQLRLPSCMQACMSSSHSGDVLGAGDDAGVGGGGTYEGVRRAGGATGTEVPQVPRDSPRTGSLSSREQRPFLPHPWLSHPCLYATHLCKRLSSFTEGILYSTIHPFPILLISNSLASISLWQ